MTTLNVDSLECSSVEENTAVPVLMYHRVGAIQNAWERRYGITPEGFEQHLKALVRAGYRAISAHALVEWLNGAKPAPAPRSFVLTFDDGFKGLHTHAAPLLADLGWPYTVFLVTDLIGKEDEWTRSENPSGHCHPLLGQQEITEMAKSGASFQSHSLRHHSLPSLDDEALYRDLRTSKEQLEDLLHDSVDFVAYPFGHSDDRVQAAARAAGYRAGFSTQPGFNRRTVDRFRVRRLDIAGTDSPRMLMRKLRFGSNDGRLSQVLRYFASRVFR